MSHFFIFLCKRTRTCMCVLPPRPRKAADVVISILHRRRCTIIGSHFLVRHSLPHTSLVNIGKYRSLRSLRSPCQKYSASLCTFIHLWWELTGLNSVLLSILPACIWVYIRCDTHSRIGVILSKCNMEIILQLCLRFHISQVLRNQFTLDIKMT